jgi:hypothetical protein
LMIDSLFLVIDSLFLMIDSLFLMIDSYVDVYLDVKIYTEL